ncbi:hypothetical protein X275_10935 [Marinitoga sp. 1197]|nr:hypothetical protein X275_10935 [Marinitoga sp. 1197]
MEDYYTNYLSDFFLKNLITSNKKNTSNSENIKLHQYIKQKLNHKNISGDKIIM